MSEKQAGGQGRQEEGGVKAQTPPALELMAAKLTDVGRARPHNEDYVDYYIPPDPRQLARKGAIYLVADGMGGHQAGEVASQGAVEAVIGQYYSDTTHDTGTSLVRAFRAANQQIHAQAQSDPSKGGMGTTLVAAVILGRKVYVANVGDSRAYLINEQGIAQITEDHSWVEEQVRAGLLTPEQAKRHPQRNLVTRALGSKPAVEVDLFEGEISTGDTLLLCSDGLTGRVEDHELVTIVQEHPPQQAVKLLVDLANERGGNDNISVLMVKAQEEPATVKAPVFVPPKKKPAPEGLRGSARRPLLIPALVGVAALLVVVLGVLVGIPAIQGLLHRTPTPTVSPVAIATTVTPTVEVSPTVGVILTPTETVSPTVLAEPTSTPVTPTSTLAPTPTATVSPPTPTLPVVTPAASKTPAASATPKLQPQPTLLEPTPDAPLEGPVTFKWQYPRPLGSQEAFQVLIWREGETKHNGAAEPWQQTEQKIDLDQVPQIKTGGKGHYFWSVVVIRKSDEKRLSQEAAWRRFEYIGPQSPTEPRATESPRTPKPQPTTERPTKEANP